MKIQVTQEKLSKALNNLSRIASSKSTLPILKNVLIRVDDKKVSLVTTNLDMAIVDFLPVSSAENGVITVPAKLLTDFVSNLPRGDVVEISSDDTKIKITSGKYSSTINGTLADDFPSLPEIDEANAVIYKLGIDEFKVSVNQVVIACSHDVTRPALTGVYFNTLDGGLAIAATDGYRLTEKKLVQKTESEVNAIVPASALQEVLRSINDDAAEIEITFNEDLVRFRLGEVELISKLIDASYPDYRKLFPRDNDITVTLNKDELIRVTKLASLFARATGDTVICEAKEPNIFSVHSIASEVGVNDSELEAEVENSGKVGLTARFLLDALNSLEEPEITFNFANKLNPIILKNKRSNNFLHLVMPLNK